MLPRYTTLQCTPPAPSKLPPGCILGKVDTPAASGSVPCQRPPTQPPLPGLLRASPAGRRPYACRWFQEPPQEGPSGEDNATHEASTSGRGQQDADASADAEMQRHFETMQEIGQRSAVPEMLPRLMLQLRVRADVDAITERLRYATPGLR